MPKYRVTVKRVLTSTIEREVEADNEDAAGDIAIDDAIDSVEHEWSEEDGDYSVEWIDEIEGDEEDAETTQ